MFFKQPVWGMVNLNAPVIPTAPTGYDTATNDWISNVNGAGGSVSTPQRELVDNLIVSLKVGGAGSLWNKCDGLWVHGGEGDAWQSRISLKNGLTMTFPLTTPTITWRGMEWSGADGVGNTTINPSVGGTNFTANAGSLAVYIGHLNAFTYSSGAKNIGAMTTAGTTSTEIQIDPLYTQTARVFPNNLTGHDATIPDNTDYRAKYGLWLMSRTAGTGSNNVATYRDGTQIGLFSSDSITVPDNPFVIAGRNDGGGTYHEADADPYGITWIGGPLDSTEAATLSTLLLDYLAAHSIRPVRNGLSSTQEFASPWGLSTNMALMAESGVIAPDGSTAVKRLYPSATTAYEHIGQAPVWSGDATTGSTFSCYIRNAGWTGWVQMRIYSADIDAIAWFFVPPVASGSSGSTVGTLSGAGATSGMSYILDGWWRCWVSAHDVVIGRITPVDADNDWTSTADGTNGINPWGAQVNAGPLRPYNRMP